MTQQRTSRRKVVLSAMGLGVAPLVSTAAAKQTAKDPGLPFPAADAGPFHQASLQRISSALAGAPLVSKEGLLKMVNLLVEYRMINKMEAEALGRLIYAVFDAPSADEMANRVTKIYDELVKKAGDVAVAIASVARDSVEYARKLAAQIDWKSIAKADLTGAVAAATIGTKLPPLYYVVAVVVGAGVGSAFALNDSDATVKC